MKKNLIGEFNFVQLRWADWMIHASSIKSAWQTKIISRQMDMSTGIIQFNRLMKIHTLKSTLLNLLIYITVSRSSFKGLKLFDLFQGYVTGHDHIHMLQNESLSVSPMNNLFERGFQQDEAPPHNSLEAGNWLDVNVSHRWIGRRGEIEYPLCSPD